MKKFPSFHFPIGTQKNQQKTCYLSPSLKDNTQHMKNSAATKSNRSTENSPKAHTLVARKQHESVSHRALFNPQFGTINFAAFVYCWASFTDKIKCFRPPLGVWYRGVNHLVAQHEFQQKRKRAHPRHKMWARLFSYVQTTS